MRIDPHAALDHLTFGDALCYFDEAEMWNEKYSDILEFYGSSFFDKVANVDSWYGDQVLIMHHPTEGMLLCDGHHRFAAAFMIGVSLAVEFLCEVVDCPEDCHKILY